jgi:TctA family transporter
MLTIFAIPVCVIVLMVYGILLYLAPVITGIILGRLVLPRLNRYLAASIGAGVITLLMAVPYLKVLLFLLSAFYVLGILIRRMKPRREGNHPEVSERPYND